jgi:hypothetical protein
LPTSGFENLNGIRNALAFFYTEAWINAELSRDFAPFVEYDGKLYIHTTRAGFARPDWETATHALIELSDWSRADAIVETKVLMRHGAIEESWEETFRVTFVGGGIDKGPGAWAWGVE